MFLMLILRFSLPERLLRDSGCSGLGECYEKPKERRLHGAMCFMYETRSKTRRCGMIASSRIWKVFAG